MAQTYGNIVTPTAQSTVPNLLQNALTNKISPQPLTPLVGMLAPTPFKAYDPSVGQPKNVGLAMQYSIDKANAQKQSPAPTYTPSTPSYAPTSSYQPLPTVNPNPAGISGGSTGIPASQTPSYSGLVSQLATSASKPSDQYTQAFQKYQDINDKLAQSRINQANALAGNKLDPVDLTFQQGRGQVLTDQYLAQQNALASELGATSNLLSSATGQQSTQQSGLLGAAGLAQPTLNAYGQTYYSPLLGGAVGGQGVQPSDPFYGTMQTYAQLLASNQPGAIPASITGNSVLNAQLQQMARQINPNYNFNTAQGVASAQQYNTQTGGTAGTQANQAVLNPAYASYLNLQQTTQNVDQFGGLLLQTMRDGGINPTDIKFVNKTIAAIRDQFSSQQQAIYDNTLATLRSRVSGLLAQGGSEIPTAITADAQKILDGSLPVGQLQGVLQRITQEGQILLNNQANIVNSAYSGIQGNQNTGTSNGTVSAGGYNFKQDANGNWIAI